MEFSEVTYTGGKAIDEAVFKNLPTELKDFYNHLNGIIAFNGGLHIRGCVSRPEWHSLHEAWKGDSAFHLLYEVVNETDIPFGQDCVGDQFFLRDGYVFRLSSETGDIESLELTFEQFLNKAISDPMEFLLLQPLQQFMNEGGRLEPGKLLSVYPPFCMEEAENGVSLRSISSVERISFLADLCRQIKNAPNR
jgi:hypothetical protein